MVSRRPLPDDIEERLPLLAEALRADGRVEVAYLFGGLGAGRRTPLSDVDVAVLLIGSADLADAALDLMALANEVLQTDEVDLVVLNRAPLTLRYRVVQGGCVLMERRPPTRAAFESRTLREGWDFRRYEERMLEAWRRRWSPTDR